MASAKKAPRKKSTTSKINSAKSKKIVKRRAVSAAEPVVQQTSAQHKFRHATSPKDIFQAGLSALSLPRAESAMADGLSKIADSFGFKKLEDVFDQRVASALERIGIPSAEELNDLIQKVGELSVTIQAKKTKTGK